VGKIIPNFGQNPKTFGLISTWILVWGHFFKMQFFHFETHKNEFMGRKNWQKVAIFQGNVF
jgi:hypothetical protein